MQKKSVMVVQIMICVLLIGGLPVFAAQSAQKPAAQSVPSASPQPHSSMDQDIEMLRQDIRSQRKQITAANITLTADEATKFWPIYDEYIKETIKINDIR
jgi:hypothetical protein